MRLAGKIALVAGGSRGCGRGISEALAAEGVHVVLSGRQGQAVAATVDAIHLGHPEEVLAAVLATGAVLAAIRGRRGWAAVLLGLAVGTKQWAVLAAIPVLLALDDHRFATAVRAAGLALLLTAVLPIADPRAFARADSVVGGLNFTDPFSLWWPLGSRITLKGRRWGVPLARQTLADWLPACAELLRPLYRLLRERVLQGWVVGTDDTPVAVQEPGSGRTRAGPSAPSRSCSSPSRTR